MANLHNTLEEFKKLVLTEKNDAALSKLNNIKRIMVEMDSLPPFSAESPNAEQERAFAKEALELAVLLSVNIGDKDSFQKYVSCLRPYYTSISDKGSDVKDVILGLNLLYLLVENRLSDFHCELELLSETQRQHPAITFCTQLDKHLVVGSYDQVLVAAANPPVKYYSFFLTSLLETVRINIGECIAAAYTALSVAAATKMLMFDDQQETLSFLSEQYPSWTVSDGAINLIAAKVAKSEEISSMKLISQNLMYATELERIV